MEHDQVVELLRKRVETAGSLEAAARQLGVTRAYVWQVLKGETGVSERLANAMGFDRRMVFVPKK